MWSVDPDPESAFQPEARKNKTFFTAKGYEKALFKILRKKLIYEVFF
jgi:hypothetical protein